MNGLRSSEVKAMKDTPYGNYIEFDPPEYPDFSEINHLNEYVRRTIQDTVRELFSEWSKDLYELDTEMYWEEFREFCEECVADCSRVDYDS